MAERNTNSRGSSDRNRGGSSRDGAPRSGGSRSGSGRPSSGRPSSGRPSSGRPSSPRPAFGRPDSRRDDDRREENRDARRNSTSDGRRDSRSGDRREENRGGRRNNTSGGDRDFRRGEGRSDERRNSTSDGRRDSRSGGTSRSVEGRSGERRDSRSSTSRPPRLPSSKTGFDNHPRRGTSAGAPVGMAKERGGVRNREVVEDNFIEVSNDIDTKLLPKQVLAELRNISAKAADYVGKHLAAAMMALEDDDAERAYQHAIAARSQGSRLASVREMCGLAAYYNEKWSEALNEFRTYQRITGDPHFMPLMADCERGLGRPEKALNLAKSDQVRSLDADTRIEFRIVISGARADLKQFEAALATLECPELHSKKQSPAVTRLKYAYANALQQLNRLDEARDWFVKTSLSDAEDSTDAAERAVLISELN